MNRRHLHVIIVPFIVVLFGLAAAVGLGMAPQLRAASPIYVRTDGDDATCNGEFDAPATNAPDCAFATIGKGAAEVDGGGTIIVAAGVYTENVSIDRNLTLKGAGAGSTILDGGGTDRVIHVWLGYIADISGVTIRNGYGSWGGGIRNQGTLTLSSSTVVSNNGALGAGGIYNSDAAILIISDCIVIGNSSSGEGGGIYNDRSTVFVANSAIISNSADSTGGGIHSSGGKLFMDDSAVRGNRVPGPSASGGGIFNDGEATLTNVSVSENSSNYRSGGIHNQDPMTLTNVTISGNTAVDHGGGIIHAGGATLTVVNCTIASNTISAGTDVGGILLSSPATVENTLLAHNDNANCSVSGGNLTSNGHNLDSGNSCGLAATGDITNTDPLIGPLADNGGPATGSGQATLTHALLGGSPAIDAGACVAGVTTDQRGVARPQGDDCDIGAYEFEGYFIFLPVMQRGH
jgi:hypothetical protein